MDDDESPPPARVTSKMADILIPGFITTPDVCPNDGQDIEMLIALASHPLYATSRDRVRHTWATVGDKKTRAMVFVMGDINPAIGEKVKEEAEKNHDIVMGKFRDINIEPYTEPVKRLAALNWVIEHCRMADFILIATHNEFVNPVLLKTLTKDLNPDEPAVYGLTDGNQTVVRDPNHPSYLSYVSFQGSELPQYTSGPAFLVSRAAVGPLVEAALATNAIPLYNILLTGIAADKAKVKRVHMPHFFKEAMSIEACEFQKFAIGQSWGEALDLNVSKTIESGKKCTH